jgi:hypothetical protein
MCLLTRQKKPIILKKDKIVYKVLRNNMTAIYQDFSYSFNKLYKTNIRESSDDSAFDELSHDKYKSSVYLLKPGIISIGEGFHAFTSIERIEKSVNYHPIFKCTFPAGSEYYRDVTGLCVSNQIIINELIG